MNCELVEEYISALCDGERIPPAAAKHIGQCHVCQLELNDFAAIGAELRRVASLDETALPAGEKVEQSKKMGWGQRGFAMMKIPKLAFGVMLIVIMVLSTSLVMVRARAEAEAGRFLELKYKLPSTNKADICVMRSDGSQKDNLCNFVHHGPDGLLLMKTRVVANSANRLELGVKAKYIPGAEDTEVDYTDTLFKDVQETQLSVEPGDRQEIQVAGLGTIEIEAQYLDHIPPLVSLPREALDPNPKEFRIVAPVLVRDNQVIAAVDGSSLDTHSSDPALMLYVPGDGRYLISVVPFENAVEGNVRLGKVAFSLEGHDYLLLTSMPITISEHVWVKHEVGFKPSERMVRTPARDDRPMFLVRSLRALEAQTIMH